MKTDELRFRKGVKKGLQKNNGLAQAGIEIVMDGIKQLPIAIGMKRFTVGQFFGGGYKA